MTCLPHLARADKIEQYWLDARAKWNPVADRFVAGDQAALQELLAGFNACGGVNKCFESKHKLTTAKVEASVIAVNIAWLYKEGKGGLKKNPELAARYYAAAAYLENPWGLYNFAANLEAEGKEPLSFVANKYSAASGLVVGYLDGARLYEEKLNMPDSALHYYKLALEMNPTPKQKQRALAGIQRLEPFVQAEEQALSRRQPVPVQPQKQQQPKPPQIRSQVIDKARQCISEIREYEAFERKTKEMVRKVNKAYGSLNAEKNMLDINFGHIPQGGAGAFMRRQRDIQYNAYYQRLDQWQNERDRADDSIKNADRMLKDYNRYCSMELRKSEYDKVCANNSGNTFCRSFPTFRSQ